MNALSRHLILALLLTFAIFTVHKSARSQSLWSTPVPLTTGQVDNVHPVVANGHQWLFGPSFEEMLAFSRNGKDICIRRTTNVGASWSNNVVFVTTDSADNDFPSLVHNTSGTPADETAMMVWQSRKNGNADIYFSRYSQLSWSAPQPVATSAEDDLLPHVAQTTSNYYAVWEQNGKILFSEFNGSSWSSPLVVSQSGDSLNHFPQVAPVAFSNQPLVVWDRTKGSDTTRALMYASRTGTVWSTPDTLQYAGDNRRPRFYKYMDYNIVSWEKRVGASSRCYSGDCNLVSGRFQLQSISPITNPDEQRNAFINGFMIITSQPQSPRSYWGSAAAWESKGAVRDSIGVSRSYFSTIQKLSADGALSNRNPDISQGITFVLTGFFVRIWAIWEANISGTWQIYGSNTLILIDDVNEASRYPIAPTLFQNYPNPFNPTTAIDFRVGSWGLVLLKVFDVFGREVATLANEVMMSGTYSRQFDGSTLSSGVYFYRLQAGGFVETKKLLLLK